MREKIEKMLEKTAKALVKHEDAIFLTEILVLGIVASLIVAAAYRM